MRRLSISVSVPLAALLLSACAAIGVESNGAPDSDPGPDAGGMIDVAAQQIDGKSFPLCSWLEDAISMSEPPLSIMIEATYLLTDAVPSDTLVADPAGTETYEIGADSSSSVSCVIRGYATDPDYGDEISAHTTVSLHTKPGGYENPSSDQGEEYEGRIVLDQSVLLDPSLRLEISEFSGNAPTDYLPFMQTMVDYWDSAAWLNPPEDEVSPVLDWSNSVEVCNQIDAVTLSNLFALDGNADAIDLEAQGYERDSTPGAVKCTFSAGEYPERVELVFERWNSAEEVSDYIAGIAEVACSTSGDLAFYQYGGDCDTETNMSAYGYVDSVEVEIC